MIRSERFHRLGKEFTWIILGQAIAVLGSMVGVRLLTELLDPASYGKLALGMTLATLVNQTVLGPLCNGVTRFYAPAVEKGELGNYLIAVRRSVLSSTGIVIILTLLAVAGLLITRRTEWIAIAIAAFIFSVLSGYNSILSGIQNAARQRSIVALHLGMESWARFLGAFGLIVLLGATSTVALIGYAIGIIMVLGSQYVFFLKITPKYITNVTDEKSWRVQMWQYSWPFATWGLFTWAQQVSDRWALELFTTTQEVGLYSAVFQLGYYPMSMASGMAIQFLTPIFYHQTGDASDDQRNANVNNMSWQLTVLALGVTCAAFLTTLLFHKQIFQVFVSKDFINMSRLLPWVVLASGIFSAGQTITLNLMSQMRTQSMVIAKVCTAVVGVILNFAGAYWYGTTGIVFAGISVSCLYFAWMAMLFNTKSYIQ